MFQRERSGQRFALALVASLLPLFSSFSAYSQAPATRLFESSFGLVTPLPAPIEISYRPIGRVSFRLVTQNDGGTVTTVGHTITGADGALLRRQYTIERIELSLAGKSVNLPIILTYDVKMRPDGEHVEIGAVAMSASDASPDASLSSELWRNLKEALRLRVESNRIENCLILPRFPANRATNDSLVGLATIGEMLRRH